MELFLTLLKNTEIIGISRNQHPFNWRSLLALLTHSFGIALNAAYFFCEANTFQEYSESIFIGTIIIADTIIFVFSVSRMWIVFEFINEAEKIIDGSEFEYLQ